MVVMPVLSSMGADAPCRGRSIAEEVDERRGGLRTFLEQEVAGAGEALDRRLRHGGRPHGSLRERNDPVGFAPQQQRPYVDPVQPAAEPRLVREAMLLDGRKRLRLPALSLIHISEPTRLLS